MQRSGLKFELSSPNSHCGPLTITSHLHQLPCMNSDAKRPYQFNLLLRIKCKNKTSSQFSPLLRLIDFIFVYFLFLLRVINSPSHFVRIFDTLAIVPIIMATILAFIFYQDSSFQTKFHSLSILINWILALYFLFHRDPLLASYDFICSSGRNGINVHNNRHSNSFSICYMFYLLCDCIICMN